jgi:hypothetical protein
MMRPQKAGLRGVKGANGGVDDRSGGFEGSGDCGGAGRRRLRLARKCLCWLRHTTQHTTNRRI